MEIRSFQERDEPAVIDLWTEVFGYPQPHNDPAESIRRKVETGDDLFLVAVEDSRIVGTVMGGYDGHRGWIYSLAVRPDFRRRGISTALMREIEKRLEDHGCPKVNLQILEGNGEVVAFYESLGYRVDERVSMGKRFITGETNPSV